MRTNPEISDFGGQPRVRGGAGLLPVAAAGLARAGIITTVIVGGSP